MLLSAAGSRWVVLDVRSATGEISEMCSSYRITWLLFFSAPVLLAVSYNAWRKHAAIELGLLTFPISILLCVPSAK